jgi:hypothetical protein
LQGLCNGEFAGLVGDRMKGFGRIRLLEYPRNRQLRRFRSESGGETRVSNLEDWGGLDSRP